MGTSQLLSVPYAQHAKTAENVFSGNYGDLANKPTLFSGSFADLINTPTTVAGYGITDAFSGDYNDLANLPTIPNIISDLSDINTTGATTGQILSYDGSTWIPSLTTWIQTGNSIYYNNENVGIGTMSPEAKLDIVGSGANTGIRIAQLGSVSGILVSGGSPGINILTGWSDATGLLARVNSTTGIGVKGEALQNSGTTTGIIGVVNSPDGTAGIFQNTDIGGKILSAYSGTGVGAEVFTVQGDGRVGIGTTSPGYNLDINGDVNFVGNLYQNGNLFNVFSGDYEDLKDKPSLFNGQWSSLSGTIPNISIFNNDVGYLTTDSLPINSVFKDAEFAIINQSDYAEPPSGTCNAALAGIGAGNVDNGIHSYKISFITETGETEISNISNEITVTYNGTDGQIQITNIPVSTNSGVIARKIYRRFHQAGTDYKFVAEIPDNTTTTYLDNIDYASLGAVAPLSNSSEAKFVFDASSITENRTYTTPDESGTIALKSDIKYYLLQASNTTLLNPGFYVPTAPNNEWIYGNEILEYSLGNIAVLNSITYAPFNDGSRTYTISKIEIIENSQVVLTYTGSITTSGINKVLKANKTYIVKVYSGWTSQRVGVTLNNILILGGDKYTEGINFY